MYQTYSWREKIYLFASIMWPILVTQMGLHAMTVIDTMMSGRAGTADLAGVAIGSSIWFPVFLLISGIILAVTPTVAQLLGSGQHDRISSVVTQAIYLTVVLSLLVGGIGAIVLEPLLSLLNLDASVQHIAKHYLIGLSIGMIPLFVSNVVRNFFDAQGYTRITMIIILAAIPFNIVLNYVLIFGKFGFPRLGGIGAGYATALTYWIICIISIWMTFRYSTMRVHRLFVHWIAPSLRHSSGLLIR
jgi:MATE family multidrug resistance protein